MFLVDTDVVSEARKKTRANPGVRAFLDDVVRNRHPLYVSVVTVGELRRAVERIRQRGGTRHARRLEGWLESILEDYAEQVLGIGPDVAQVWGVLDLPGHASAVERQIAATARIHDLTLVTRNAGAFAGSGVAVLDPFSH